MAQAPKAFNTILNSLSPRQREVVAGRFGLEKYAEPETLAAIGKRLGVTRERVRQIERSGLMLLQNQVQGHPVASEVIASGKKALKGAGGVLRKDALLDSFRSSVGDLTENHVALVIEASGAFALHAEDKNFHPFYFLDKAALKTATGFLDDWANALKKQKREVLSTPGNYEKLFTEFVRMKNLERKHAEAFLAVSKRFEKSPYGDVGLREWPEINPTTIRDRIYLVLKKKAEPLHFEDIAKSINQVGFDDRKALGPTVHNELIKDDRFVLVGRGVYGLREHGYVPGTAKEVIHRILKNNGPLKAKDVIDHVNKERFFKPNTILINLQDKESFLRQSDGSYRVRES